VCISTTFLLSESADITTSGFERSTIRISKRRSRGAIASKYRNAGQTSVCGNRILAQDGVYDAFTKRLAETAGAMKVADGFEPSAVIGPLIDMKAVEKVEAHIADAIKKGVKEATVLTDVHGRHRPLTRQRLSDILRISRYRVEKPMQVQVARWGNSLGLRIPKDIALRAGLREGARVDVEAEGDRIIVSPARPRYVLADLLKGMTPEAMRQAFDWGPDKGREIVE